MSKKIKNKSFRQTEDEILESIVLSFEVRLEKELKRLPHPKAEKKVDVLYSICNILWGVMKNKYRKSLSSRLDKKLYATYTKHLWLLNQIK